MTAEKVKKIESGVTIACLVKKMLIRLCFENRLLEAVTNNLPTINSGGEVKKLGDTQATFTNPEYGWIPGPRWRGVSLKKDPLEEIIEAGFCAPTIQEDFLVPP